MAFLWFCLNLLLVLLLCLQCDAKIDMYKYFRSCNRDSDKLSDCLKSAVREGIVNMAGGIPEVDLPPIDPHFQEEVNIAYKANQVIAKLKMANIETTGLKTVEIQNTRAKIEDNHFVLEIDVTQPTLRVRGNYNVNGSYHSMHISTRGIFNCTLSKLKYTWKLEGTPERRYNDTYCRITNFWLRPEVGDMKLYASDVFPDNPQLTEQANKLANENWPNVLKEMLPYIQEKWGKIGLYLANKLFLKVPYYELFPKSS